MQEKNTLKRTQSRYYDSDLWSMEGIEAINSFLDEIEKHEDFYYSLIKSCNFPLRAIKSYFKYKNETPAIKYLLNEVVISKLENFAETRYIYPIVEETVCSFLTSFLDDIIKRCTNISRHCIPMTKFSDSYMNDFLEYKLQEITGADRLTIMTYYGAIYYLEYHLKREKLSIESNHGSSEEDISFEENGIIDFLDDEDKEEDKKEDKKEESENSYEDSIEEQLKELENLKKKRERNINLLLTCAEEVTLPEEVIKTIKDVSMLKHNYSIKALINVLYYFVHDFSKEQRPSNLEEFFKIISKPYFIILMLLERYFEVIK